MLSLYPTNLATVQIFQPHGIVGKMCGGVSTNVWADVLAHLITWHGTYTFTWGQRDRSFPEPWPLWFSLCFNWAQETHIGKGTWDMITSSFGCRAETSTRDDSANMFAELFVSLIISPLVLGSFCFFPSGCLGGNDWITNNNIDVSFSALLDLKLLFRCAIPDQLK